MVRTSRSISRTAARLAAGRESPGRAGGPATPATVAALPEPVWPRAHPLFVTADPELLDDLLRLAAAAGVTADVALDPAAARRAFPNAVRVYIGVDMAEPCARAGLPQRPGVVVVIRDGAAVDRAEAADAAGGRLGSGGRSGFEGRSGRDGRSGSGCPPNAEWEIVQRLGAEHVAVLPAAEPWLIEQLAASGATGAVDAVRPTPSSAAAGSIGAPAAAGSIAAPAVGRVVAVLGGRGGAGASVLAGGLAVTAARRGLRTLLVDADPLGGGVDLVLGWESLDGLRWPALSQASGEVPAPALVEALPGHSELVILSWDRGEPMTVPPEAMLAALDAGRRGRDLTIVDLPRRLDESAMLALRAADQVYLVVPAELRACAAAARVAAVAGPHCAALSVVVRQPGPTGLAVKDVMAALRLPYAGTIRSEPRLRTAWERGEPPAASGHGSLATLCGKLLDDVVPVTASQTRGRSANGVIRNLHPASREASA